MQVLAHDRERIIGGEWLVPGQQLEQHHADRVEIGAPVDRATFDLLGRHVVRCADDDPGRQLRRIERGLGEPEIEDPDLLGHAGALGDHHVRRLDVAMHDPELVGVCEPREHLPHDRNGARGLEPADLLEGIEQ